ncbi:MAG: TolC family protein, partial [Bacteroidota bacterium]
MRVLFIVLFLMCMKPDPIREQEKKSLSLQDCIEIAIENNLTVRRSQLNLASSKVDLMQSKGQRYPTLNAGGNYGFNWGRAIDPTSNLFVNQRINFNGLNGSSNLALFQGRQLTNTIRQNKLNVAASQQDVARSINDISLSVALTYLNVILNMELLQNAKFQLASSEEQLDRTKKLVASGALPISNELQLVSQQATNEVSVINAENNLDLARLDLKQSLLLPPGEEIAIVVPEIEVEVDQEKITSSSIEEIYQFSMGNQPEIKSADLRVQSAGVGLQVSRGALYPSLGLNGGFSTNFSDQLKHFGRNDFTISGFDTTQFTTVSGEAIVEPSVETTGEGTTVPLSTQYSDNFNYSVSLGLSIPIFNGFSTRANIQRAKIGVQQAEINAVEERNALYQSIETAYRNAVAASKTYSASKKQVTAL